MLARHYARSAFSGVSLIALLAVAPPALAATFNVSNETELAAAIDAANSNGDASNTINVSANITLTRPLPPLGLRDAAGQPLATSPLAINGYGNTISGGNSQRIFFANAGQIAINDVTLADGRAKGGDGGDGHRGYSGGGGLGAGGALFVRGADAGTGTGVSVVVSGVAFAGNSAVGGAGGVAPDVSGQISGIAGGGGGMGGSGGGKTSSSWPAAGGGGAFSGQNGGSGNGGGTNGGNTNQSGGDLSGGGGAGRSDQVGGAGGFGGGGGGGDGGSSVGFGGAGGFGGGGGGAIFGVGGLGGFGGGGGGGLERPGSQGGGGSGGFAGGNGGGGSDRTAGGGGGALGGALFVAAGGSLTIASASVAGGSVTAGMAGTVGGTGGTLPTSGQAAGTGMFLQGNGTVTFAPTAGKTVMVSDVISDEQGFLAATPGYAKPAGFNAGAWGLTKTGTGTLTLSGANTYTGGTTLSQGTLSLGNDKALGSGALVAASGTVTDIQDGVNISNPLSIDQKHTINVDVDAFGTYSGPISEARAGSVLYKTGAGYLTLSGTNTHTGGTTISAGNLRAGSASALGSGALTVASGANLLLFDFGANVASISGGGDIHLGDESRLVVGSNNLDTTYSGAVWGDGTFEKIGTGTLTLNGGGQRRATTMISEGTLLYGRNEAINSAKLVVASGAVVDLAGFNDYAGTLSGGGDIRLGAGHLTVGWSDDDSTFSGVLSGSGSFTKIGTGTLTLSGTNIHSGGTVIEEGTLLAGSNGALGIGAVTVDVGATLDLGGFNTALAAISGGGNIKLGAGHLAAGWNNLSSTFSGVLSGSGEFMKMGAGTLTLSGTNVHSGGTRVWAGTLKAGSNSALGSGALTVDAGASLDLSGFNATVAGISGGGNVRLGAGHFTAGSSNDNSTFSGAFSGSGRFDKAGSGTLTLTGDSSSFSGSTTVQSGALTVGVGGVGKLGGAIDVKAGARLGGSGTIGGAVTVANGATHGAGNSVGTQTINGNYVNRGVLEVEATPAGADRLNVKGTVDIAGAALNLLLSPPTSASWNALTGPFVLIANDGNDAVTGAFGSVGDLNKLVFLNHLIDYAGGDGNDVTLKLVRNDISVSDVGQSRNQQATGGAIDGMALNDPVRAALILSTDRSRVRTALDALSGEVHASLSGSFIEAGGQLRDAASDRIRSAFGGVAAADIPVMAYGQGGAEMVAADSDRFVAWGQALGNWRSADGDGNAAAFSHSSGGMLAGGDVNVGSGWRVGLLGGYSRTSFEASGRASSGSSDNFHLGVYGGGELGVLGLRAGASYTRHAVETTRNVVFSGFSETLKADYEAGTAQAFVEAGYALDAGGVAFEPFAGLAYARTSTDGFSEAGGSAALTSAGATNAATLTTLGLRAASDFSLGDATASVRGMVGWRRAFGDLAPSSTLAFAGGDSFTIHGTPIARDALLVEAGLDVAISPTAGLGLSYTGQLANGAQQHGAKASLGVRF